MTHLSKRAIDLRQQMEQIRCDLAGNVSHLSDDAKTLTDYRYYVRQYPWITLGAASAAGFFLIPRKTKQLSPVSPDSEMIEALLKKNKLVLQTKSEVNQKRGLIATGASLLAAVAMRAAMSYAQKQALARFSSFGHVKEPSSEEYQPSKPR